MSKLKIKSWKPIYGKLYVRCFYVNVSVAFIIIVKYLTQATCGKRGLFSSVLEAESLYGIAQALFCAPAPWLLTS
jgi:hypothetical protein